MTAPVEARKFLRESGMAAMIQEGRHHSHCEPNESHAVPRLGSADCCRTAATERRVARLLDRDRAPAAQHSRDGSDCVSRRHACWRVASLVYGQLRRSNADHEARDRFQLGSNTKAITGLRCWAPERCSRSRSFNRRAILASPCLQTRVANELRRRRRTSSRH